MFKRAARMPFLTSPSRCLCREFALLDPGFVCNRIVWCLLDFLRFSSRRTNLCLIALDFESACNPCSKSPASVSSSRTVCLSRIPERGRSRRYPASASAHLCSYENIQHVDLEHGVCNTGTEKNEHVQLSQALFAETLLHDICADLMVEQRTCRPSSCHDVVSPSVLHLGDDIRNLNVDVCVRERERGGGSTLFNKYLATIIQASNHPHHTPSAHTRHENTRYTLRLCWRQRLTLRRS